jgi:Ala-tRNA(Pro) deacylase
MPTAALAGALDAAGLEYELLPHTHTERAADEAQAVGVAPEAVAKTLVVTVPDGYVRAVIPASARLDLHKLRELLGVGKKKLHLASEDDLERDYPEFELGAVPPVGGRPDPVLVDARVVVQPQVVFEAGNHDESVRVRGEDLRRIVGDVQVVDICED